MKKFKKLIARLVLVVSVLALLPVPLAHGAQITSRSLTLQDTPSGDGGSKPGGVVRHFFGFTLPTSGNVGSVLFQYCTTATGTCTVPTGLVTTSATLGSQSGLSGFTLNNTTNGGPYVTNSTPQSITGPQAVTVRLDAVTNPTTANKTFFVRITSYASTNTTGSLTDSGTVAASTTQQIVLTGVMPESLVFCTGHTITTTGGVPDCTTATSGSVSFDREFSPTDTSVATSQMAASTNAGSGYNVTVSGATLTSGANTITNMSSAGVGVRNSSQFGMNLRANTVATSTPAFGSDVAPTSNASNFRAKPLAGYDTVDTFKFVTGDSVADSSNANASPIPTDAQIYTASYIVNVPGSQPAGTYTTTLTYVCTATF